MRSLFHIDVVCDVVCPAMTRVWVSSAVPECQQADKKSSGAAETRTRHIVRNGRGLDVQIRQKLSLHMERTTDITLSRKYRCSVNCIERRERRRARRVRLEESLGHRKASLFRLGIHELHCSCTGQALTINAAWSTMMLHVEIFTFYSSKLIREIATFRDLAFSRVTLVVVANHPEIARRDETLRRRKLQRNLWHSQCTPPKILLIYARFRSACSVFLTSFLRLIDRQLSPDYALLRDSIPFWRDAPYELRSSPPRVYDRGNALVILLLIRQRDKKRKRYENLQD